jgi:hypothetical protein
MAVSARMPQGERVSALFGSPPAKGQRAIPNSSAPQAPLHLPELARSFRLSRERHHSYQTQASLGGYRAQRRQGSNYGRRHPGWLDRT